MHFIGSVLGILYLFCVIVMSFYGLNSIALAVLYLLTQPWLKKERVISDLQEWPQVTIQLPVFNEKYTLDRLLKAITRLDYPHDCLQIQLLDDSTDETILLAARLTNEYRARGINIEHLCRTERAGYKAGALKQGLEYATGEFIAIFDADFVPSPDWLKKTVPLFQDSKLGCVQTRLGHTNREYNLLTRAQALAIDSHFIVQQTARSSHRLFTNFNGTAGMWRRACIEDVGNWHTNTLTEDLDLSYRAQLNGWRIDYIPDLIVPGELPVELEAFKAQQFRWAKGSLQVTLKTLRHLLARKDISWHIRLMAFLHLTEYIVHPLMVIALLLTPFVGLMAPRFLTLLHFSIIATFGPPMLFILAGDRQTPSLLERLRVMPILTGLAVGFSLNSSIAVLEALIGKTSVFVRTPKLNLTLKKESSTVIDHSYLQPIRPIVWGEACLGFYALSTILILQPHLGWGLVSWLGVYALSYFYVAGLNLVQHWQIQVYRKRIASAE